MAPAAPLPAPRARAPPSAPCPASWPGPGKHQLKPKLKKTNRMMTERRRGGQAERFHPGELLGLGGSWLRVFNSKFRRRRSDRSVPNWPQLPHISSLTSHRHRPEDQGRASIVRSRHLVGPASNTNRPADQPTNRPADGGVAEGCRGISGTRKQTRRVTAAFTA